MRKGKASAYRNSAELKGRAQRLIMQVTSHNKSRIIIFLIPKAIKSVNDIRNEEKQIAKVNH